MKLDESPKEITIKKKKDKEGQREKHDDHIYLRVWNIEETYQM